MAIESTPGRLPHGTDAGTKALYWAIAATVYAVVFTLRAPSRVVGALWSDDSMEPRPSLMTEARWAAHAAAGYAISA